MASSDDQISDNPGGAQQPVPDGPETLQDPDRANSPEKQYTARRLNLARLFEEAKKSAPADADSGATSTNGNGTTENEEDSDSALRAVELRLRNAQVANEEQDLSLRRMVARWSIGFVCAQLVAANGFFGWYLWFNNIAPDPKVMIAWLTSSVIEVIGIVAVIARSLFPGNAVRRKPKLSKTKSKTEKKT
ncbi:hypothetical protein [Mycolicibacterium sp. A43C]